MMKKYRCYASMMTGNSLNLFMSLAEYRLHDAAFLTTIICGYFLGGAFARKYEVLQVST